MTEANPTPKTVAQMLGEITWLMTQSPIHKQLFIGDLEWFASGQTGRHCQPYYSPSLS